ncbi:MAG: hypothetical protein WAM71_19755 [Candidatus Korobacteraceae bacterium]
MTNRVGFILFATFILAASVLPASARSGSGNDRVQFGSSINVSEDEQVGDLVCIGCSIRMAGTCGDVVAIGGRIDLEGHAKGDVVAVGGGVRLSDNAQVGGDVVTIGGALARGPGSEVGGEIVSQGGSYVFPLLIIVPLIPVVLIVALIWWLITRNNRRQVQPQAYPGR